MTEGVVQITDSNFLDEVIKSDIPVLVDFWAGWCGPCKIIAPVVEELARDYSGRIKVGKLDVDENTKTATIQHVMNIPTLILFNHGKEVERFVGVLPKDKIAKKLEAVA